MTLKWYKTTIGTEKPRCGLIRAINQPLKLLVVGVFLFFGLFLIISGVLAQVVPFVDDFNSYITDQKLDDQGSWVGTSTTILIREDENCLEEKCIEQTGAEGNVYRSGIASTDGQIYIYFKLADRFSSNSFLYFADAGYNDFVAWFNKMTTGDIQFSTKDFNDVLIAATDDEIWYELYCEYQNLDGPEWENKQIRCKVDEGAFTPWRQIKADVDDFGLILPTITIINDRLDYISDLEYQEVVCTDFTAMSACQEWLPTCCWGWSYAEQDFTCDWCPTTECTETPDPYSDCAYCSTEASCNAQEDHCYWWAGSCKYGAKVCGPDLKLQFCLTDGECTTAGGYWYGYFCWVSPLMGLTSWPDYYDSYGDYETPSDWINNLATSIESFFGKVGGFIFSFTENFDVAEAMAQGENLGSAIPKARAYLGIFNSFFGDFPVGEIFLFVLALMLCVGVFRLFRNLKFW